MALKWTIKGKKNRNYAESECYFFYKTSILETFISILFSLKATAGKTTLFNPAISTADIEDLNSFNFLQI